MDLVDLFFYYPMRRFGVRELGRLTSKNSKTVMKHLRSLVNHGIITRVKQRRRYPYYEANHLSKKYKLLKSIALLEKLATTGLIDFLEEKLSPSAIILFGSAQKGTYLKGSDIDLFIQGKEKHLDLALYEQKLKHEIQLFFEEDLYNLTEGLRNNIISGSTLCGGLKI